MYDLNKTSSCFQVPDVFIYCITCCKAFKDSENTKHPNHNPVKYENFSGIFVKPDFITGEEEKAIVKQIEQTEWVKSQSGRQKQV